jgi:hypothetical protein
MAERVGFEPTLPFRVNTLSKRAPSATRPSLPDQSAARRSAAGRDLWESIAGVFQWQRKRRDQLLFDSMVWSTQTARPTLRISGPVASPPMPERSTCDPLSSRTVCLRQRREATAPNEDLCVGPGLQPNSRNERRVQDRICRFFAPRMPVVDLIKRHERHFLLGSKHRRPTRCCLR